MLCSSYRHLYGHYGKHNNLWNIINHFTQLQCILLMLCYFFYIKNHYKTIVHIKHFTQLQCILSHKLQPFPLQTMNPNNSPTNLTPISGWSKSYVNGSRRHITIFCPLDQLVYQPQLDPSKISSRPQEAPQPQQFHWQQICLFKY